MSNATLGMTLEELAGKLKAEFRGRSDLRVTHACGLDSLSEGGVAYVTDPGGLSSVPVPIGMDRNLKTKLLKGDTSGMVFIVTKLLDMEAENLIYAEDPLDVHVKVTLLLHKIEEKDSGVHPSAVLAGNVQLGEKVLIGAHVFIGDGVWIG